MRRTNPARDEKIARLYAQGIPATQIAREVQLDYCTVYYILRRDGITRDRRVPLDTTPQTDRNATIRTDRQHGRTLQAIATDHGITRERVRQICANGGPDGQG